MHFHKDNHHQQQQFVTAMLMMMQSTHHYHANSNSVNTMSLPTIPPMSIGGYTLSTPPPTNMNATNTSNAEEGKAEERGERICPKYK